MKVTSAQLVELNDIARKVSNYFANLRSEIRGVRKTDEIDTFLDDLDTDAKNLQNSVLKLKTFHEDLVAKEFNMGLR